MSDVWDGMGFGMGRVGFLGVGVGKVGFLGVRVGRIGFLGVGMNDVWDGVWDG